MTVNSITLPRENRNTGSWKKKAALFLSSQSISMFGSMLVQYAIIWYITLSTQSGAILTISTLAGFLPQIVISLFAGESADRYSRKFLIISAAGDDRRMAFNPVGARVVICGGDDRRMVFNPVGIIQAFDSHAVCSSGGQCGSPGQNEDSKKDHSSMATVTTRMTGNARI